jgi:hypothetical protein
LLETFTQFNEDFQKDIFDFIIQQTILYKQDWPYEADVNLLRLIMKVTDIADKDSCAILASSIFATNSRIWLYRFLYSNSVKYQLKFCLSIVSFFSLFKMFYNFSIGF